MTNIQPYWATQSALTALVPASNVWIGIAADSADLPCVILDQIGTPDFVWTFGGAYIQYTRIRLTVYAQAYSSVDPITQAIITAFKWKLPTPLTLFSRMEDIVPAAEEGGAYRGSVEFTIAETYQS